MKLLNNIKSKIQNIITVTGADKVHWIDINKIIIDPELKGIFLQKESDIKNIFESMKKNGFDPAHPIILSQDGTCVDGNTRYIAAQRCRIKKVAVIYRKFDSREQMIEAAYQAQLRRRNLTELEIYNAWSAFTKMTDANGKKAKSDQAIADELSISRRQVAKFKEVERKADKDTLESFKSGEITLNAAYTKIKADEVKEVAVETLPKEELPAEEQPSASTPNSPKASKTTKTPYQDGYFAGIRYALDSLANGKTSADLLAELDA